MRHEQTGYLISTGPAGTLERDGIRCHHCQTTILVQPDKGCDSPRMRIGRCGACHRSICVKCEKRLATERKCAHFEKKLEAVERRAALRKSLGVGIAALALLLFSAPAAIADSLIRPAQTTVSRPPCTEARAGVQWRVAGATNVADTTATCQKLADNTWAWVLLDVQSTGGGTPATSVVSETSFGASSAVGSSTNYARQDHTHGSPSNPVPAHEAASDPHTGYQRESEKGQANGYASLDGSTLVPDAQIPSAIARDSETTSAISTHEGASDPHTGYQRESEKGAASGYASLDVNTRVPTAQLGTGTANSTTFLRGDGSWQTPAGGADGPTFVRVATSDYTNSTVTPSNITGLSFALDASSVYSFGCDLFNASAAATTGVRPGLTYSGTSAHLRMTCQIPASTSALAWFNVAASGASCDATASQGTGVALITIAGTIETTNAGTLQIQGESEVAASQITIHRGSSCWARKH